MNHDLNVGWSKSLYFTLIPVHISTDESYFAIQANQANTIHTIISIS